MSSSQGQSSHGAVSSVVTTDHPLAAKAPEIAPITRKTPSQSTTFGDVVNAPSHHSLAGQAVVSPTPQMNSSMSMEDMVNVFLSGPSFRSHTLGLPPVLRPAPLRNESPLQCLRTLVERRAWGDVLQISADILHGASSPHASIYTAIIANSQSSSNILPPDQKLLHETAEVMVLQCHAWLKLRRYSDMSQEIEKWRFVAHNNGKTVADSTWIPWSLHILAAESLHYSNENSTKASDELFAILERIPDNEVCWKISVDRALANLFLRERAWRLALMSLERTLNLLPNAVKEEVKTVMEANNSVPQENAYNLLYCAYSCEIYSVQGRILLQIGAVNEAAELFQYAKNNWEETRKSFPVDQLYPELESHHVLQHIIAQLCVNDGLICFAYPNYVQALECFKKATDHMRSFEGLATKYRSKDYIGPTVLGVAPHNTLFNECINNMAICALYTCRLHDAVSLMESLVREDPTAFLTERVAFNLCTLYELGADSAASIKKKRVLQLTSKRFFLHDIGPESFRLN